jgi:1-phosphatidylinositol phosphodiesterase
MPYGLSDNKIIRMAFYGWPVSQCQTVPLVAQLEGGIRVIDIRLAVVPHSDALKGPVKSTVNPELIAYHGWWPQQTPFLAILNDVYQFLSSPAGQSESIVMSIKQEDAEVTFPPVFSQMVRDAIVHGPGGNDSNATSNGSGVNQGMWFLENRIPTLGEVRGKVVLVSRFGGDGAAWPERLEGIGIHPTIWPDNRKEGFEWDLKGTRVRTHDWYVQLAKFFWLVGFARIEGPK